MRFFLLTLLCSFSTVILAQSNKNFQNETLDGRIIFSKKATGADELMPSDTSNRYEFGEKVYFYVYTKKPLLKLSKEAARKSDFLPHKVSRDDYAHYFVRVVVDDGKGVYETIFHNSSFHTDTRRKKKGWQGKMVLQRDMGTGGRRINLTRLACEVISKMPAGDHKVTIELYPAVGYDEKYRGSLAATGTVTLHVPENTFSPQNPEFCYPEAAFSDSLMEQDFLNAFKTKAEKDNWTETPVEAVILENDWIMVRNKYSGILLRRERLVLILSVRENGKCFHQKFWFAQEAINEGFGSTYLNGIGDAYEFPCKCLEE